MTNKEWEPLPAIIRGERFIPIPVGFIIDSPWLPNRVGILILDDLSNHNEATRSAEQVEAAARNQSQSLTDLSRIICPCGGGMPPWVPSENIRVFVGQTKSPE